jgi:hypothetical protein
MNNRICTECNEEFSGKAKARYCSECLVERQKIRCRNYKAKNKQKISEYNKTYKQDHKQEISEYNKEYDKNNRTEIQNRQTKYQRNRRMTDPIFKMCGTLRNRMNKFISRKGRNSSMSELLGCTYDDLILWLEYQFDADMSMSNHGDVWHCDHVIPCSLFDQLDENEQQICWHWSNIKPMHKSENISKQNKLSKNELDNHNITIKSFIEEKMSDISDTITILEYDPYEYVNC